MPAADPHLAALSDDKRQLLESWLLDFDLSWDEGRLASWSTKLPPPGDGMRLPALVEMVKIDLERRWQRGERARLESYVQAWPELGAVDSVPADLIKAEYEARQGCGSGVDLAEFTQRFPRQADELRWLLSEARAESPFQGASVPPDVPTPLPGPSTGRAIPLPETFGRYRIVRKLGEGSMGTVYLAHDGHLDRQVALKVPRFAASDDLEVRQRFMSEARAAATIEHPNICPVYDVGEIDGTPYLTMAYLDGQPLSRLFQDPSPVPLRQVAALVGKLALALQEAHNHGIIHRDLKPSNIMINQRGEPVILDFGLARRLHKGDARLTLSGQPLGTPAYMSPEQVVGAVDVIGPSSDVYCLGVVLYQLLTRRLPFEGSVAEVLGQIVTRRPDPPSKYRSDLDPRLEAICLKALSKEVAGRYATMREFAAALAEYSAGGQVKLGWRAWLLRRPLHLAVGIVAGLALTSGLLMAALAWNSKPTGTLRIELDDPSAEVEVQLDGEVIDRAHLDKPLQLSPGQHQLLITGRRIKTVDQSFSVARGDNSTIQVKLVPKKRHHEDDDEDKKRESDDDHKRRKSDDDKKRESDDDIDDD
jgi:hypothetical protein